MIELKVKRIPEDEWCRSRLKNVLTERVYADVSLGNKRHQPVSEVAKLDFPEDDEWMAGS